MSLLTVFADEAGPVPLREGEGTFVVAAVSYFDDVPTLDPSKCQISGLAKQLAQTRGMPFVCYLDPQPGYGRRLALRLQRKNTLAQKRRAFDGNNAQYCPAGGEAERNQLWIDCMLYALTFSVVYAAARSQITEARIVIDRIKVLPIV